MISPSLVAGQSLFLWFRPISAHTHRCCYQLLITHAAPTAVVTAYAQRVNMQSGLGDMSAGSQVHTVAGR